MKRQLLILSTGFLFALVGVVQAGTISVNFVGSAGDAGILAVGELAGNSAVTGSYAANWNNAFGASGLGITLSDSLGNSTGVTLSYFTALGTWSIPNTAGGTNVAGGENPKMMKGYLDADERGSTVTLSGLNSYFRSYQVLLYFDGDNEYDWRVGQYTITNNADSSQLFGESGEDSEYVDFNSGYGNNANGMFQIPVPGGIPNQDWPTSPNNNEGNFLITSNLNADSITITSMPTSWQFTPRVPLNGIQVIGVPAPEPGTLVLLGIGALSLVACSWRRPKRRS